MKVLLDTRLLLRAAGQPNRLSADAPCTDRNQRRMNCSSARPACGKLSSSEDWGGRTSSGCAFASGDLLDYGCSELPIASEHVVAIEEWMPIHKDPFDRVLLAQVEGITLPTADPTLAQYPGPVRLV